MSASIDLKYFRLAESLPGRRAIITGAAAGLGRAIAMKLARDGWALCLIDQDGTELAAVLADLKFVEQDVQAHTIDVTDHKKLRGVIETFGTTKGGVELLINSAGIGLAGNADEFSSADWDRLFNVNVVAVGSATAAVLPLMKAANCGHIVNIASAAAYHCLPWLGAYSASKAAVVALTENLAAELAGTKVKASVMISAFFKSSMPRYTMGGPLTITRVAGLMKLSAMTSEDAAEQTLRGLEAGGTYIVIGSQARLIYRIKRFAPNLWLRLAPKVARKAFAKADAAALS
jgi:short-subunit dehydrogenase